MKPDKNHEHPRRPTNINTLPVWHIGRGTVFLEVYGADLECCLLVVNEFLVVSNRYIIKCKSYCSEFPEQFAKVIIHIITD